MHPGSTPDKSYTLLDTTFFLFRKSVVPHQIYVLQSITLMLTREGQATSQEYMSYEEVGVLQYYQHYSMSQEM